MGFSSFGLVFFLAAGFFLGFSTLGLAFFLAAGFFLGFSSFGLVFFLAAGFFFGFGFSVVTGASGWTAVAASKGSTITSGLVLA
ncbi:MAG: hypothetical protein ACXABD_04000 [Candidatus Thorarchaeota archaeon]